MTDTRERLLASLRELADDLGAAPRTVDMARHGDHDPVVYHTEFGSWGAALEEAGIDPSEAPAPEPDPPDDAAPADGQETPDDGDDTDGYTHLAEAHSSPTETEEALLGDLRRFYETYSRAPTRDDVRSEVWMASTDEYDRHFGGVVEAAREAGVVGGEYHQANKTSEADADDLLGEIRRYHSLYGEVPSVDDIDGAFWTHPASVYLREFGDWRTALTEAGLE